MCQKSPERRKVGDTLTAEVVDRNGKDVSDNVTFQWYADDVAIEGADEETLVVDDELLGAALKVVVTAENGNTFESEETEAVTDIEFGEIEIVSAEAVKANKIEVTLANAVISTDVDIEVMKGTNEIDVTASWSEDFDSVTLTTPTNMSEGEYTVTLTSIEDETNTDSAYFEVEAQAVAAIVILNDVALTNKDKINGVDDTEHTQAYAYYDVIDQYGESVRTSASVQWSGSADVTANKATGLLTLTKSDDTAWVYGDKIFLTGVYTKTGVATTAELTVGTEQALDTIEVAGFVKKNTTTLEKTLPADFKSGEWYLLFNAYDQNGNLIAAGGFEDSDVNIISDNVLVVKEVKGIADAPITIDDVEYNAILVEPGLKVADGGKVVLTAIASRTGNKTEYECIVGVDQVIVSFTMSAPASTIADGEEVEIPFVALDEDGNTVTDFATIAKHETFNALSLNVGGNGRLYLQEQADGSAKLYYNDAPVGIDWDDKEATDGIDRPVSLTAVVLGGGTDNQMISVSDMARPDAIKDVDLDDVYVEGASIPLSLDDIEFYDQYGRDMGDYGADNGFFGAAEYTGSSDFSGYNFSVRATYTGNGGLYVSAADEPPYVEGVDTPLTTAAATGWILANGTTIANDLGFGAVAAFNEATVFAKEDVVNSRTNEGFKFEIVKVKAADVEDASEYEVVSRSKSKLFTIIDINAVKNFTIGSLGTLYVGAGAATGDGKIATASLEDLTDDELAAFEGVGADADGIGGADGNDYQARVKLTGTYNGSTVTIPNMYYTASGKKVAAVQENLTDNRLLNEIIAYAADAEGNGNGGLSIQDLYDKTSARGVSKIASDTIKATVWDIFGDYARANDTVSATIGEIEIDAIKPAEDDSLADGAGELDAEDLKAAEPFTVTGLAYEVAEAAVAAELERLGGLAEDGADYAAVGGDAEAEPAVAAVDLSAAAAELIANEKEELEALRVLLLADQTPNVVDTASIGVTLSDQAPVATSFDGFADTYTFTPALTLIDKDNITDELEDDEVAVLDQYGVDLGVNVADISRKVSSIEEDSDGYVENNFTTTGNNSTDLEITGAERGDTFELTLIYDSLEQSATVTVGADALAFIDDDGNAYTTLLLPTLDNQRKAILGIELEA